MEIFVYGKLNGILLPHSTNDKIVLDKVESETLLRKLLEAQGGYIMPGYSLVMGWK